MRRRTQSKVVGQNCITLEIRERESDGGKDGEMHLTMESRPNGNQDTRKEFSSSKMDKFEQDKCEEQDQSMDDGQMKTDCQGKRQGTVVTVAMQENTSGSEQLGGKQIKDEENRI